MKKEPSLMIVDDCYEDRLAYHRYLSREANYHYHIFEAEYGEDALAKYASIKPELILLDYSLPDCNGLEFIEHLRSQTDDLPPIIMLSGQGNETVAVKAIQSGAYDYCVKDYVTAETLNKTIDNVLEKYHLNTSLGKNKRQQQLIKDVALLILQSSNLQNLFKTTVTEVHKLLKCDRVLLCRFDVDLSGKIVAESVKSGWRRFLGTKIDNSYFLQCGDRARYRQGEILTFDDIKTSHFSEHHLNLLAQFQVKASAMMPILLRSSDSESNSWGLLIAHHCHNPHQWQQDEIEVLEKLSLHLSIAIQQAELLKSLTDELAWRKQAEAKIRRARQQILRANNLLEQRVEKRTKELDRAKQAAETANRAKDSFLAHISHELRTPLNSILGFTQILKKESNLCDTQHRYLDFIYQSGRHLLVLIDDILDLSKITARKLDFKFHNFDFLAFINNLTELIRLQAQKKGLNFDCQLLSPLPEVVEGDETRLRQVLLNLLNNAVKFTEVGSIVFTVESVPDSQRIRFLIQDTGMGISAEQLDVVFLPFEQLPNQQSNRKGTGLGLAISSQLVQLMDSRIIVKSTPGKGSTFWFDVDLPAVDTASAKIPVKHQYYPIGFQGQRRKILTCLKVKLHKYWFFKVFAKNKKLCSSLLSE